MFTLNRIATLKTSIYSTRHTNHTQIHLDLQHLSTNNAFLQLEIETNQISCNFLRYYYNFVGF